MNYCLPINQFVKNKTMPVHFSYAALYAPLNTVHNAILMTMVA